MTDSFPIEPRVRASESSNNWVLLRAAELDTPLRPAPRRFDVPVVEDDPVLRQTIAFSLQSEGYEVMGARDGVDALRVLEAGTPWLILLDMHLPGMNGPDFAVEVRASGIRTRIAVVTGSRDARDAARELAADDYLAKPFAVDELLSLVLRQWAA